ncbi:MAG: molybdopterin-synthase adenylyltransferase MoeB [Gemmatimonadales bacterium]
MTSLTSEELVRYARHLTLAEVGVEGQERLKGARVLLVGAGGLGSPAALYLAAAGVGTLGIVEDDRVDATNLQRQVLHGTAAIGRPKLDSARERLRDLNPAVTIEGVSARLQAANALEILGRYDFALDGSDNFPTRYLVNDASVLLGKPYVYGAILRFDGQVSVFGGAGGPCYRCIFREPPPPELVPNCAEAGVLGVLPGVVGSLMAAEAIKLILGAGEPLVGRLLLYDALRARVREIAVARDPACPVCGDAPTLRELIDYDEFCGIRAHDPDAAEVSVGELATMLGAGAPPDLLDVREPWEWEIARLDGSRLIPLGQLARRIGELDTRRQVVAVCHKGVRSLEAQRLLEGAGFRAWSLRGGIDAWATEIDRRMKRY